MIIGAREEEELTANTQPDYSDDGRAISLAAGSSEPISLSHELTM